MLQKIAGPWPRREHFRHYMDNLRCTYSLTVQIDITAMRAMLRSGGLKSYPAQIHMLAATVNRFPEMRMGVTEAGQPGFWEILHPSYTVFNGQAKTFSSIWTPYREDFSGFYRCCVGDMRRYQDSAALFPQDDTPPNLCNISSVPWIDFTAFNLNVFGDGTHLQPIFTIGRYVEQAGKTFMPLALQLHHAACDGYHAGQFVQALRDRAAECRHWLQAAEPE